MKQKSFTQKLFAWIFGIFATIIILALAGMLYISVRYKINPIIAYNQIKQINQTVDANALAPNSFGTIDMESAKTSFDDKLPGYIKFDEQNGYVFSDDVATAISGDINLTDKQVGAIFNNIYCSKDKAEIQTSSTQNLKEYGFKILQTSFSNLVGEAENLSIDINIVAKIETAKLKEKMNQFPHTLIKKHLPDHLYISTTSTLSKNINPMTYSVTSKDFKINNLSEQQSQNFLTMINAVDFGNSQQLSKAIGELFARLVIGDNENLGLCNELIDYGVTDYNFVKVDNKVQFVISTKAISPTQPTHTHSMQQKTTKMLMCNGKVINYFHCSVCKKNFLEEEGITEFSFSSTSHSPTQKFDNQNHWTECVLCGEIVDAKQKHNADRYKTTRTEHYKVCDVCKKEFGREAHNLVNDVCTICDYTENMMIKCNTDYAYNILGTFAKKDKYQAFYNQINSVVVNFHNDSTRNADKQDKFFNYYVDEFNLNYKDFGLTTNEAFRIWSFYKADHPLIYWLSNTMIYTDKELGLRVDADYINGSVRNSLTQKLYAKIQEYLTLVENETSPYQIAFAFHDKIIEDIDYAKNASGEPEEAPWAHNIVGVFEKKSAVCEGYAEAFGVLLNACKINNIYVSGKSEGQNHAWNLVDLGGGNWYWYDLTWDDQPESEFGVIYDYMCVEGATFKNHVVDEIIVTMQEEGFDYSYALPTPSTTKYTSSDLQYGDYFSKGKFNYEVCGYNRLQLVSTTGLTNIVDLSNTIEHQGRVFNLHIIGKDAFANNRHIQSISIPTNVKYICNFAFYGTTSLNKIEFKDTKNNWLRKCSFTKEMIDVARLKNPQNNVSLLNEYYQNKYQYIWEKRVA